MNQDGDLIRVDVPVELRQPRVTVVVLEIADEVAEVVDETLQQEQDGVIKLPVSRCEFAIRRISYDFEEQVTHRWGENTKQGLIWTVNVTQPGSFRVISEDNGNPDYVYELTTADGSLSLDANENVGQMSRKPHEGTVRIEKAGAQKISVYPKKTVRRSGFKFKGLELVPVE